MDIEKIIKEVFKEAGSGKITINSLQGDWIFFVKFYVSIEGRSNVLNSNYPILNIDSYKEFLHKCEKYLNVAYEFYKKDKDYYDLKDDFSYLKKLFMDLIVNATYYNLDDPINYIDLKTKQLTDKTIKEGNSLVGNYNGANIYCKISKNVSNLEAPYRMSIIFKSDGEQFTLPTLTFGVDGKTIYLMCIQNTAKNDKDSKLVKKLDRYFRKVNKDVSIDEEISKVSPNALVALSIFNEYMLNLGLDKVVASNFMPIRYNNNKVKIFNKYKDENLKKKESIEMIDYIQSNITEKFMNLLLRYNYHFDASIVQYDEVKDEMHLFLKDKKYDEENIIYDIVDSIKIKNIGLTRK